MNIRRFPQFAAVLAIIVLIAGLSACDQIQQLLLPPTPPETEEPSGDIIIGLDLPLTGPYADPYGFPMQHGFELARAELNQFASQLGGPQITFITEDDQSTVEGAVAAFNKLIDQHGVSIITGIAFSTQAEQAFPIAQENGVVAFSSLSAAAGLSAMGDFIFRAALTTKVQSQNGVRITQEKLGYTKAATIYDTADVYTTSSNSEFTKALMDNEVEIVTTATFQGGDTDFSAQLTQIMEANPEVIFVSALSDEIPQILSQGREIGIDPSVHFIVTDLTGAEIENAGDAAEGAITFANWTSIADTPGNQAFVENYQTAYGIEPDQWAAQSYATLYILVEAIATAGSTDAMAVRDALANIMDLDTILGQFSFNADGDAVYDPTVLTVTNGELTIFE